MSRIVSEVDVTEHVTVTHVAYGSDESWLVWSLRCDRCGEFDVADDPDEARLIAEDHDCDEQQADHTPIWPGTSVAEVGL